MTDAMTITVDTRVMQRHLGALAHDIPRGMELGIREAAEIGTDWIDERLNQVLRTQTPYYRLQIEAHQVPHGWAITDGGVVYGPWLEGVSRRNMSSRFKGYHTFRYARQRLAEKAHLFVERHVMAAARRIGRR